jgi:hypothetical protein
MRKISGEHYRELAEKLRETISGADFYNGSVELDDEGHSVLFRATLIIKRTPALDPADHSQNASIITDIIPVWWEYHRYDAIGERLTDFDWHELKKFLT